MDDENSECFTVNWGQGHEKNRTIKRFRNRASSNHNFISISINRTALTSSN